MDQGELVVLECEQCGGLGCDKCNQRGEYVLEGCPKKAVQEIVTAVNLCGHADKGHLPVAGGILDQSAWFISFWERFSSEVARIDRERIEKQKRRGR